MTLASDAPAPATEHLRSGARWIWQRLVEYAKGSPLPQSPAERLLFGLMQPVFAFRLLARPTVLHAALYPALLLMIFCAAAGILRAEDESPSSVLRAFYQTFAVLAPLPSVLLANHYARLAVAAHQQLGLGPCTPHTQSITSATLLVLRMAVLVAVGIAPLLGVLRIVPALGQVVVAGLAALWALFSIVVEALDSARVAQAAPDPAGPIGEHHPWFIHVFAWPAGRLPLLGGLLRRFSALSHRLARPWREEIVLCEQQPALFLGFSLTTAALLATPVLNLLFRPIIIIAAVHVLGQLRRAGQIDPAPATEGE